jgi:hypothetical protein
MRTDTRSPRGAWVGTVGLWLTCALVVAVQGCGGKVEEFSATQSSVRRGQKHTTRLFVAPQRMRLEMPHPSGRGSFVTIVREDRKVAWILMPEQRAYREMTLDQADLGAWVQKIKDDQVIEELGQETVAGYACRKVRVRTKATVMGMTIESTSTVWLSPRLPFPLRSEGDKGNVMTLEDIVPGKQPADLFEVPADFQKVEGLFPGMFDDSGREQEKDRDRSRPSLADKLKGLAKRH